MFPPFCATPPWSPHAPGAPGPSGPSSRAPSCAPRDQPPCSTAPTGSRTGRPRTSRQHQQRTLSQILTLPSLPVLFVVGRGAPLLELNEHPAVLLTERHR